MFQYTLDEEVCLNTPTTQHALKGILLDRIHWWPTSSYPLYVIWHKIIPWQILAFTVLSLTRLQKASRRWKHPNPDINNQRQSHNRDGSFSRGKVSIIVLLSCSFLLPPKGESGIEVSSVIVVSVALWNNFSTHKLNTESMKRGWQTPIL